jgi:pimeloyl-ACP methyl ester carboxylesterase
MHMTAKTTFADTTELRIGDLELRYRTWGQGEPLLFLHGFFGASVDLVHLFDPSELGREFRVIAPDLRGHGGTANTQGTFSHRECARDVLALLDALEIASCRAIGVSLGGNTLMHMATMDPARIQAMVTVSSPAYFPSQARALMAQTQEPASEAEWTELRAKHVHGDEQIRALYRTARGFATSYDDMSFTPPLLSTIRARTLLVAGDSDPLYPVAMFAAMHEAIPKSALWVLPESGHAPIFTTHREAFASTALAFLRRSS